MFFTGQIKQPEEESCLSQQLGLPALNVCRSSIRSYNLLVPSQDFPALSGCIYERPVAGCTPLLLLERLPGPQTHQSPDSPLRRLIAGLDSTWVFISVGIKTEPRRALHHTQSPVHSHRSAAPPSRLPLSPLSLSYISFFCLHLTSNSSSTAIFNPLHVCA